MDNDGYVMACLCEQCHELPTSCLCPDGFHLMGEVKPHPHRCHCCRCGAIAIEFVTWQVGDSYSVGALCTDCRNRLDSPRWSSTHLTNDNLADWILGKELEQS